MRISKCCGANLSVESADEGTSYYSCEKCGKPTDPATDKPKPYTDEEIVEKLADGRLAETNIWGSILFASAHSQAKRERNCGDGWHDWWTWPSFNERHTYRITIPLPPKRRALRREDLPEEFKEAWIYNRYDQWTGMVLGDLEESDLERGADFEYYFKDNDENSKWLFIDEPQEPLVISAEGGE